MPKTDYNSSSIRAIVLGIIAFIIFLIFICGLSEIIKTAATPFLFIPDKLGWVRLVHADQVMTLNENSTPTIINFTQPGRYAVYTNDYDLLVAVGQSTQAKAVFWISIKDSSGQDVSISVTGRGLRPYDTALVKGRPVYTFEIVNPGEYTITHPTRGVPINIVPDTTTGKEGLIYFLYGIQISILLLPIILLILRANRKKAQKVEAVVQLKKINQNADFWKKELQQQKEPLEKKKKNFWDPD